MDENERTRRLAALWQRAAAKAIAEGFPPAMVANSMLAAAVRNGVDVFGPAQMSQTLGGTAAHLHQQAGGDFEELLPGETANDDSGAARH